ncbi:hypothetical protein VOLCADRAFT_119773 [Volvox carteri f. nagariensis]|uniref:Cwf19-like C-terminal domain-containing protein n=1 Tax=Volvox carteri f. nagariensis TaxID=3068 RepID=D8UGG9_VOLCA|nr:uncharacterized protein VOLCADRAFT_119773 [Volvox carteri f. nagariensis]EFJ41173.1 hypothetical protein VOLCADRAFT_119773 [Volvox carteri f. nagariensis]|eukprot:XP_002957741.1 hypothetical protein VOLCADRAFT_119773 [Volvox carteri f. nagariensis]
MKIIRTVSLVRAVLDDGEARRKKDKKATALAKAVPTMTKVTVDATRAIRQMKARTQQQTLEAKRRRKREDWMTKPMKREPTKAEQQHQEEEAEEEERRKQAAPAGSEVVAGLRIMKTTDSAAPEAAAAAAGMATAPASGGGGGGGGGGLVGDGGASWRLKALRRAQEQARAEGRSLQEVVGERWGSLAQLTGALTSSAAADGKAHLRPAAERRRAAAAAGGEGAQPVVPHYLQDVRGDGARTKMLRPSEDTGSLSWRRDRARDRDTERPGAGAGEGDRNLSDKGQRERDLERHEDSDKKDERGRGRGEREPSAGATGGEGAGGGGPDRGAQRQGSREGRMDDPGGSGCRHDGRYGDRGFHNPRVSERRPGVGSDHPEDVKAPWRERDRDWDYSDRERGRARERERARERSGGPDGAARGGGGGPPRGAASRPSKEQAAALQQLAGSLNSFTNDGSFLERFMSVHQLRGKEEGKQGVEDAGPGPGPTSSPEEWRGAAVAAPAVAAAPGERGGGGGGGVGNRGVAAVPPAGGGADAGAGAGGHGRGGGREPGAVSNRRLHEDEGDEDEDEDGGDRGPPTAAASRRAPLFVGSGDPPEPPGGVTGGGGNKSAAELLRARLKGLPAPSPPPAAPSPAVKPDPDGGEGGAGFSHRNTSSTYRLCFTASPSRHGGAGLGAGLGSSVGGRGVEVVQLPLVDSRGRAVRGAFGREAAGAGAGAGGEGASRRGGGGKPPERYNRQTGEKERYFADDDKVDLQTMLRRAKYGDDNMDMDEHLAANIAKKRKFRGTELDVDAEYDYDGGLELYESRTKRGNTEAQRNRERSRQVADLRRQASAEAGCALCLNNPNRAKHLTIALGTCTHLSLPYRGRLVRGHCVIAPSEHCPSVRGLDEVTWTEVKNFIKCLVRMYGAHGQSVIFMETYMMTRGRGHPHGFLDVVPVSERQLEKARGYFKKAILEAESEWSTHHAKACIETTAQKGLRESIPPNFPYFYVQFGYGSGYVHVIDNEAKFDPNFGRQVLIGLLDLPPEMAFQRQKPESLATQQQWVREFESQWDPFDWTRQLHQAA